LGVAVAAPFDQTLCNDMMKYVHVGGEISDVPTNVVDYPGIQADPSKLCVGVVVDTNHVLWADFQKYIDSLADAPTTNLTRDEFLAF
jgi:hypothetical protein